MNPLEVLARGIGGLTGLTGMNMQIPNAQPIPMEGRDTRFLPNSDPYARDYGMSRQVRQGMQRELQRQGLRQGVTRGLTSPYGLAAGALLVGAEGMAPASAGDGTLRAAFERGDVQLDPLEARRLYGPLGDMDAGTTGIESSLNQGGRNSPTNQVDPNMAQAPVSRAELEQRAYQNEASRLGQQVDPFLRGGSPMLGYDANAGMTINQAIYGDQGSFSTPNPMMMGLNYNMQEPVGQEQSMAQAMADRFRNDQMQFQTGGMGAEPGMLSGMDPSMFLARLEAFEPGGPRRSKGGKG